MSEATKQIEGYVRVARAANIVGLSRQWLYALGENGKLAIEQVSIAGRGGSQQKAIKAQSLIDFVRGETDFDGKRTNIINKIRAEAANTKLAGDVRKQVMEAWERLGSIDRVATELNMGASTVKSIVNPRVKLSDEEVQNLTRLHGEGKTLLEIAAGMGWGKSPQRVKAALHECGLKRREKG